MGDLTVPDKLTVEPDVEAGGNTLKIQKCARGSGILDPRDTYADASEWEKKAQDLASRFVKNFVKYEGNEAGKALVAAGPKA